MCTAVSPSQLHFSWHKQTHLAAGFQLSVLTFEIGPMFPRQIELD